MCLLRRDRTKRQSIGKILVTTIGENVATLARKFATNTFCWLKKFAWCDCKMTKIKAKSSPNISQVSTNVLLFRQTFSVFAEVLEIFNIIAIIRGLWHLTQNSQTVGVFPKYSLICGQLVAGLANAYQLFTTARQAVAKNLKLANSWVNIRQLI